MKKLIIGLLGLVSMLWALPGGAWAGPQKGETVTWLILDLPPFFITEGPDKGRGLADQIQAMVQERLELDGYQFRNRAANAARIAKELTQGSRVCFAGEFYGNPDFLTSVPTVALLPHTVVARKADAQRFGDGKAVSLESLLKQKDLVLGTARGRLYGPKLDSVLKKHGDNENIYERSGKDILQGLLGMLIKGRVDYIIEYPVSIRYAARKAGVLDQIVAIPIEENSDAPPIRGAIRCPDTPWGRQMIQDINRILVELRPLPDYRRVIKNWAAPPGREALYWDLYEEQVLNVTE